MSRFAPLLVLAALTLPACGDPDLAQKVAKLETRVDALEAKQGGAPGAHTNTAATPPADAAPAASDADETAAGELFREANQLSESGDFAGAKTKIDQLYAQYGTTKTAQRAARLKGELDIIGEDAGTVSVDHWFQGSSDFTQGKATLVVFWEVWCPHCQEEVPKLEDTYEKYKGQGLNVIAVTKVTRSATDQQVTDFIKAHNLEFPVAKEDAAGSMSNRFGVTGIPAAAVIKDGKVVWRGHPARLNDAMLAGWLAG